MRGKHNVSMAEIDVRKAFEFVDCDWLCTDLIVYALPDSKLSKLMQTALWLIRYFWCVHWMLHVLAQNSAHISHLSFINVFGCGGP